MNLLFDLISTQPNVDGKFHGGGEYAKKIFKELLIQKNETVKIYGLYDSTKYLDENILSLANKKEFELLDFLGKDLVDLVKMKNIDRVYSALPYNLPQIENIKCETIGTIHGLRGLEFNYNLHSLLYSNNIKEKSKILLKIIFRNFFLQRNYKKFKKLINHIKIITVSNHSKYSIISFFPDIKSNNISVCYAPDVTGEYNNDQCSNFIDTNYFLLVSGNRVIKNNLKAVIALDQIFSTHIGIKNKVILTGVTEKKIFLNHIINKKRFIFYDYIDGELMQNVYKNAFALIFLSLNEGFGYPPLAAMKNSVPVIASPFTSITEICGDAVLYCNPTSIPEIKNRILQLFDGANYERLQLKGILKFEEILKRQENDLKKLISILVGNK